MNTYTITYWTGETKDVSADSMHSVFEKKFGGKVGNTGYNRKGVRLVCESTDYGSVYNKMGDYCATVQLQGM